jgi:hypothetical protein
MGNTRKHTFYPTLYPNINCIPCNTQSIDTWPHLLLACTNPNIYKLRIKRYNNAVWELYKLLLSTKTSRCLKLVNVGTITTKSKITLFHNGFCLAPTKQAMPLQCKIKTRHTINTNPPHNQYQT